MNKSVKIFDFNFNIEDGNKPHLLAKAYRHSPISREPSKKYRIILSHSEYHYNELILEEYLGINSFQEEIWTVHYPYSSKNISNERVDIYCAILFKLLKINSDENEMQFPFVVSAWPKAWRVVCTAENTFGFDYVEKNLMGETVWVKKHASIPDDRWNNIEALILEQLKKLKTS